MAPWNVLSKNGSRYDDAAGKWLRATCGIIKVVDLPNAETASSEGGTLVLVGSCNAIPFRLLTHENWMSFSQQANHPSVIRLCLASWLLVTMVAICSGREPQSVRLSEDTLFTFASVEAGKELIGTQDRYTERLGKLEIQLRMGSAGPVTKQQYLKRLQAGVAQWSSTDIDVVKKSVEILRERMKEYRLPFPEQIHLIRVSAQVEQNAPHCRGSSIVLPDSFFDNLEDVTSILAHELFHVLSSFNPELRDRLYRIIHFERSNKILLPEMLQDQRLTNPDAPINEHVIQLMIDGKKSPAVPVLLTKTKEFRSGGLFVNLDLKIMLLESKEGEVVPRILEGRPQLLHPREVPDYLMQIGRNTNYIIHPEETLADNFWMMLLGSDRIQDEWVIDEMRAVLAK